jgi:ankyrin repeat protein
MRAKNLRIRWIVPLLAIASLGAASHSPSVALAVQNRDRAGVVALLKERADVNAPTADGTTALHWTAYWNDVDIATLLLRAGAKVDVANRYNATPLWLACTRGNAQMVETLLKAGADPNAFALQAESPLMAAAFAGSAESVKALLTRGAFVNAKDEWHGQTALMRAVGNHEPHPDVARVLIEHGADVNLRSKAGLTALLLAVRQHDVESVRLLLEARADVNDKVASDPTATGPRVSSPGVGTNALRVAINHSYYDIAELLLDKGADPNATDSAGFTALHAAVMRRAGGNPERGDRSEGELDENSTQFLKTLLARGANPNAALPLKRLPPNFNPDGYPSIENVQYAGATPLWIAAVLADVEGMRILHAAGANPNVSSIEKTTPLMVAAGLGYGTRGPTVRFGGRRQNTEQAVLEAVTQLVVWGNDVNAVNENGQTALHAATLSGGTAIIRFLVDHGARLDQKDTIGRTALAVAEQHRTDESRTNQSLDREQIDATYELLRKLGESTP